MEPHPVQLVVEDDLHRNRLTVFFRLLLAFPHLIWVGLWSIAVFFVAILTWLMTLITGQPPEPLHRFMCQYIRYVLHLDAYLSLVGNPYPGFVGEEGEYPIDVTLPGRARQSRWRTLFRIVLVIPALLVSGVLGGSGAVVGIPRSGHGKFSYTSSGFGALLGTTAFLGWFSSLVRGRMPKGLRDAGAYSLGYTTQMLAYVLFVTDRYPNADPTSLLATVDRPPEHPVHLVGEHEDLRRSRVTVFFRLPLTFPHLIWIELWSIPASLALFAQWFVTLFRGTPAAPLHRFLSRYVRYLLHVYAFLSLAANPFPGFTGELGRYPLDLVLPAPARQNRWKTFFRLWLAIPAWIISWVLLWALFVSAVLTWFVAMFTGSAPVGLRNLSAYALRYQAQVNAYIYLLTDAYPHASPLEGEPEAQLALEIPPVGSGVEPQPGW